MPPGSVPELQQKIFKQMGIDVPEPKQPRRPGQAGGNFRNQTSSRKEQRRADRNQKKSNRYTRAALDTGRPSRPKPQNGPRREPIRPVSKPTPKPAAKPQGGMRMLADLSEDDELTEGDFEDGDEDDEEMGDWDDEDDQSDDDVADTKARGKEKPAIDKSIPRAVRERLAEDDAAIEEFERKLGIKKGRKSLPKSFAEDGLAALMEDFGEDDVSEGGDDDRKRKRDYDDWLAEKRRKTAPQQSGNGRKKSAVNQDVSDLESSEGDEADSFGGFSEDDDEGLDDEEDGDSDDDEEMGGFSDEGGPFDESDAGEEPEIKPRQRENPYVAPTTGAVVAKYVPPSLRKSQGSEGEALSRLRKQVQGLINRLTDANILSIVQSAEELYQNNARGEVTEMLTELILAQVCKPESLPDQFFVLTGGFAAAIYKVIGASFGSHLVRRVVEDFGRQYDHAKAYEGEVAAIPKEASNLLTFLSQLYVFEVVSCKIVFDYMERLLSDLGELNVELLLRICRMGGRLLRRDDPHALKQVSSLLGKEVTKVGQANVSVRTKFMIETINDLKNSKPKAKGLDSAVVSEHVLRMRKRLGELKSQSRRLDGLSPMGISLQDVENADTLGKWWLVGASVPVKPDDAKGAKGNGGAKSAGGNYESDEEDLEFILPDYPKKARAQGLSTPGQIAIFTALLSAVDAEQGYHQYVTLKLKKDEQLEIARVLVQCVGSEPQYNPYYALVAKHAVSNSKVRFAFQNRLWQIFRGLGESLFGEEADDDDTADTDRMKDPQRVKNVAQFYASLITDGSLNIIVLKPLDLPRLGSSCSTFLEWFMIYLLKECKSKNSEKEDARVAKVFGAGRDLPGLSAGIGWFLRKRVRKSKLISSKEVKKLQAVREKAEGAAQAIKMDE
ncbi:unnamed protein product [Clonostachys solani]|uniref:MI domain-containing protein n=1 Tax=Clonostachys solani TaxID=160281 RepID=A0A9N9VUN3_9HYPO|nr:unnamed protein product [Clonostachys solani]